MFEIFSWKLEFIRAVKSFVSSHLGFPPGRYLQFVLLCVGTDYPVYTVVQSAVLVIVSSSCDSVTTTLCVDGAVGADYTTLTQPNIHVIGFKFSFLIILCKNISHFHRVKVEI